MSDEHQLAVEDTFADSSTYQLRDAINSRRRATDLSRPTQMSSPLSPEAEEHLEEAHQSLTRWTIGTLGTTLTRFTAFGAGIAALGHEYKADDPIGMMSEGLQVVSQEFKNRLFEGKSGNYGYMLAEKLAGTESPEIMKHTVGFLAELVTDPATFLAGGAVKSLAQNVFRTARIGKLSGANKALGQSGAKTLEDSLERIVKTDEIPEAMMNEAKTLARQGDAGDLNATQKLSEYVDSPQMHPYVIKDQADELQDFIRTYEDAFGSYSDLEKVQIKKTRTGVPAIDKLNMWHVDSLRDIQELMIDAAKGKYQFPEMRTPNILASLPQVGKPHSTTARRGLQISIDKLLGGKPLARKYANLNEDAISALVGFTDEIGRLTSRMWDDFARRGGDADRFKAVKTAYVHKEMLKELSGQATGAGRALNMLSLKAKDTITRVHKISSAVGNLDDKDPVVKMMQRYVKRLNGSQHSKFWSYIPNKLQDFAKLTDDAVYNWYINAMLYSPVTLTKNLVSNTLGVTLLPTERLMSGMIGTVMKADVRQFQMAWHETRAFYNGLFKGIGDAWKVWRKEYTVGELAYPTYLIRNSHDLANIFKDRVAGELERSGWFGRAIHWMGHNMGIQAPGRALHNTDKVFKMAMYRADIARMSASKTVTTGTPLLGKASRTYAHNLGLVDNHMRAQATNTALYGTYSRPLHGRIGRSAQLLSSAPVIKYFTPFIRTNVNLMGFGAERTPLAAISPAFWRQMRMGSAQRHMALAKLSSGMMAVTGALAFFDSESLTGFNAFPGSPEWQKRREFGIPDSSLRAMDTWIDYSDIEPLNMILGPLDAYKRIFDYLSADDMEDYEGELSELGMSLATTYASMVGSQGFFQGFSKLLGLADMLRGLTVQDEEDQIDVIDRQLRKGTSAFATRMVPNILKDIAQAIDPRSVMKGHEFDTFYSIASNIGAKIPGLSKDLPGYRNFWGDEIVIPRAVSGLLNFNYLYDPSNTYSKYNQQMLDLEVEFKRFDKKALQIKVNPLEYSEMQRHFGNVVKTVLPKMMDSSAFKSLNDASKRTQIEYVISQAKRAARRMMAGGSTDFQMRYAQDKKDKAKKLYGIEIP